MGKGRWRHAGPGMWRWGRGAQNKDQKGFPLVPVNSVVATLKSCLGSDHQLMGISTGQVPEKEGMPFADRVSNWENGHLVNRALHIITMS